MPRLFRRLVAALLLAALSACGGGASIWWGSSSVVTLDELWIVSPTNAGTYTTSDPWVILEGGAFVPTGSSCPTLVAPGYTVIWTNLTTGTSATANVSLGCFLQVNVAWSTFPISLAIGANTIVVTASDGKGRTASDRVVVMRLAM